MPLSWILKNGYDGRFNDMCFYHKNIKWQLKQKCAISEIRTELDTTEKCIVSRKMVGESTWAEAGEKQYGKCRKGGV